MSALHRQLPKRA